MAHAKRLMRSYRKGFEAGLRAADEMLRPKVVDTVTAATLESAEKALGDADK